MVECAQQFTQYLEDFKSDCITLELKDAFGRVSNDVFYLTHFGILCDSLKEPENIFYKTGKKGVEFGSFWFKLRFVLIEMCPTITKVTFF